MVTYTTDPVGYYAEAAQAHKDFAQLLYLPPEARAYHKAQAEWCMQCATQEAAKQAFPKSGTAK